MADPVGFDEVRTNQLPLFSLVETPYHITSSVLSRLNIGPISIRYSKRIGRYPLVSMDQVRFCGELLFFSSSFFSSFFHSLFLSPGMGSVHEEPTFYLSLFVFLPPLVHFFFPPFLSYSNFFLPLSPCLPSLFYFLFFCMFFSSPVHQSTFITIPQSQINVLNITIIDKIKNVVKWCC